MVSNRKNNTFFLYFLLFFKFDNLQNFVAVVFGILLFAGANAPTQIAYISHGSIIFQNLNAKVLTGG